MKVLEIDNLILKTYLADVSTGCSSPPQGEMNLDWVRLYILGSSRLEEDWSIQLKGRQDKFSR